MTVSEIQGHLEEVYQTTSKDLISIVTNGLIEEVTTWLNRSLDDVYPILYLHCIKQEMETVVLRPKLSSGHKHTTYFRPLVLRLCLNSTEGRKQRP